MSILIDARSPEWMEDNAIRADLQESLPDVTIHCGSGVGKLEDVTMLAVVKLHAGMLERLPNLRLIQKMGAGVDTILSRLDLPPDVRVARLAPNSLADEIAEYCITYVLRDQRNLLGYGADQVENQWHPVSPKQSKNTTVAVLGLGHIGGRTAKMFAALNFNVIGWSRSPKTIDGVICKSGSEALEEGLAEADYVVCILPSTAETKGLFDLKMLHLMKRTGRLINAGRGDLIVDEDLVQALDMDLLEGAVLDVFQHEPLPKGHVFWDHPKITVTPHISGWHLDDGLTDVAENYRRLCAGKPLLHEVNRKIGY